MSEAWMEQEAKKASQVADTGDHVNPKAPTLQVVAQPTRTQRQNKLFRINPEHISAFDEVVYKQRRAKGKKGPELIEEALEMLFEKYGVDLEEHKES